MCTRTKTLPNADAFKAHAFFKEEKVFSGSGDGSGFINAMELKPPAQSSVVSRDEEQALKSVQNKKSLPLRNRNKTIGANLRDDRDVSEFTALMKNWLHVCHVSWELYDTGCWWFDTFTYMLSFSALFPSCDIDK